MNKLTNELFSKYVSKRISFEIIIEKRRKRLPKTVKILESLFVYVYVENSFERKEFLNGMNSIFPQ